MNILFSVFHFPPMSGGGSVLSSEIVNSFSRQGHQIFVVVPDIEWNDAKFEPKIDSKIKIIRTETPSKNNIKLAARLCKKNLEKEIESICKNEKIDFILTIFHPFHRVPHASIKIAKKLDIPVIVKIDDPVYAKATGLKSIQRSLERSSNGKALRNADKILVVNESVKALVMNEYNINEKNISIIPNGIDTKFFKKKEFNQRSLTIIFSGVMYFHRGIDLLLDSLPKIVEKFPDIKIVLLGNGPEIDTLKKITIEKNLSKFVEFKGWIPRDEIPDYLSNSIVGIGPLKLTDVTANALPIKVLEYMASALPIIAHEGTLPQSMLNDKNGFFVKNSIDLEEKLIQLISDIGLQEKMGNESFKMVERFDWENITSMIIEQYNKIKKDIL